MEWNDGSDDEQYPVAPVPTHERAWRHPSEIGQAQWTRAEPPLTIGRGLAAATTTLGGLLTVAVAWAMWPSAGAGVTAISTVVSAVGAPVSADERSLTTSGVGLTDVVPTSSVAAPRSTIAPPPTTIAVTATTNVGSTPAQSSVPAAEIAPADMLPRAAAVVAGNGDIILVTTAAAVGTQESLQVSFDGTTAVDVAVVFVDQRTGIAVLSADDAMIADVPRLVVGAIPTDATFVTVLAGDGASLDLVADDSGLLWIADWASAGTSAATTEGAPLVDEAGALVGLCTHVGDGMVLVRIDRITDLHVPAADATPRLGVVLAGGASEALTIGFVEPDGAAASAGLRAGDVIIAVDNIPALTQSDLDATLKGRTPGDTIAVTVRRASATLTVRVALTANSGAV